MDKLNIVWRGQLNPCSRLVRAAIGDEARSPPVEKKATSTLQTTEGGEGSDLGGNAVAILRN